MVAKRLHITETVDRRILGAVRFIDGNTGLPIRAPLQLRADGVKFQRNTRYEYIIMRAGGFNQYTRTFLEENLPTIQPTAVSIEISDPGGRYLPHLAAVDLPRDSDPANAGNDDSLFQPIDLSLYPSPTMSAATGLANIYASVADQTGAPLGGVLLLVTRDEDEAIIARGLTVWHGRTTGEALIPVPGLKTLRNIVAEDDDDDDDDEDEENGVVLVESTAVTITAIADPAFDPVDSYPDLDHLETNADTLKVGSGSLNLAPGKSYSISIEIDTS